MGKQIKETSSENEEMKYLVKGHTVHSTRKTSTIKN